MGIKYDNSTETWEAFYSKRHPITRLPYAMRRKGIKTESLARKVERELVGLVELKLHEAVMPNWKTTCANYIAMCRARNFSEKNIFCIESLLNANTFDWNSRAIDSISANEIAVLIKQKIGSKSDSHQYSLFKSIKGVFKNAVDNNILVKSPVPQMKFRLGDKIKKVLTEEQVRRFLENAKLCQSEWYYHWVTAVYTGLRSGELYALPWENVDFEKRQILVNVAWNSKDGFKETKSGNDRLVDIAPTLLSVLKELKLETGKTAFVLPRLWKWDKGEQARELRMFLMGMGVQPVRFHDLRATWATILLTKGVAPITVMTMGGWEDMKTMLKYMRKAGVDIRGSAKCLDLHDPASRPGKLLDFGSRSIS